MLTTQNQACFDPGPSDSFELTRKKAKESSQNQVLVYATFNEEDTIFQLYSKVIIMSWHDVIMVLEWCDDLTNCYIYKFVLNLVGNCLYAYLHVVLLPALKICNFKWQNLYGMGRRKRKIWIFRLVLIVQEKKSAL